MLAKELIEILSKFPNYQVEVLTENLVTEVIEVDIDYFDEEQGPLFVLIPNLED